jgi:translation initiation factor IF-2
MRKMASKYSNDDAATSIRVIDDSPLAAGLVGQAYEDSFNQEDREIKRGGNAKDTRARKKAVVIKKSKTSRNHIINVV